MWTRVASASTASGKQQKGRHLVLLPFKVAGKLLQVNKVSIQMNLLHTGFAIQTAGSLKVFAWLTHVTKGDLSMCSKLQYNHTP